MKEMKDTKELCLRIHEFFSKLPKYKMSDIKIAQQNNNETIGGVYVMFEEGEFYHGYPRITRVGTHQADKKSAPDIPQKKTIRMEEDDAALRSCYKFIRKKRWKYLQEKCRNCYA